MLGLPSSQQLSGFSVRCAPGSAFLLEPQSGSGFLRRYHIPQGSTGLTWWTSGRPLTEPSGLLLVSKLLWWNLTLVGCSTASAPFCKQIYPDVKASLSYDVSC